MISHSVQLRVLYRDTDKMGVVYHANYLAFFEAARNELFRSINLPYSELEARGIVTPIIHASLDYKSPAYYDDVITIKATLVELPLVRMRVQYEITNEAGTLLTTGETISGYVNIERQRPCRAPKELIDGLQQYFEE